MNLEWKLETLKSESHNFQYSKKSMNLSNKELETWLLKMLDYPS